MSRRRGISVAGGEVFGEDTKYKATRPPLEISHALTPNTTLVHVTCSALADMALDMAVDMAGEVGGDLAARI